MTIKLTSPIITFAAAILTAVLTCTADSPAAPNIVLIYADDMGYGDVGYHGHDDILTPSIDRLAAEGVYFTQGYVSASVCGPSRAGLLTGVYQQRFGCGENPSGQGFPDAMKFPLAGLPTSQPIISELLKERGYITGHVGKWHMGFDKTLRPLGRGFDEYFGFINGAHDYTRWGGNFGRNKGRWPLWRGDEPLPATENVYLTDLFSDEAVAFVNRAAVRPNPFFLYLAYNAIHHPWQVPDPYLKRTEKLSDALERNFIAAMILAMDDGIGRILNALETNNVADNTIVIFISDNGSPRGQGLEGKKNGAVGDWEEGPMSNKGGLRGFKGDTYEGGIRVPFCMKWPDRIKAGTRYSLPVSNLDIVPSLLVAAGGNVADGSFDGVSLWPYLKGEKPNERPHEVLFWRRDNDYAVRNGDWKLQWNDAGDTRRITLFNLADDPQERKDLAASMPEKAQVLQNLFDAWDSTLPDNEWWGGPINRRRNFAEGDRTIVAEQPYLKANGKYRPNRDR